MAEASPARAARKTATSSAWVTAEAIVGSLKQVGDQVRPRYCGREGDDASVGVANQVHWTGQNRFDEGAQVLRVRLQIEAGIVAGA